MAATTGYAAGVEANNTEISYGTEATWATAPAATFQAIRYTSETLGPNKQRDRPSEISTSREAAGAVTVRAQAGGSIAFAMSYGTYDDMFSVAVGADWQAAQAINGVSGDLTITNLSATTATISSTTSNKFLAISVNQWLRTLGWTNAANNDIWRITAKASEQSMTATKATVGAPVTETPSGTAAKIRARMLRNGALFKSLYFQQKLSSSLWLRYPGSFFPRVTLSGGVGQFLNGSFELLSQQEVKGTSDASTGGVLAAPTGRVHDPVPGFAGAFIDAAPIGSVLDSFSITIENQGAALAFGMGAEAAQGALPGTLVASGQFRIYFRDFTLYDRFVALTTGAFSVVTKDAAGNAYVITLPGSVLINPAIEAGGSGQPVMATFQVEGSPGPFIQIDQLVAT